MAGSAVTQKRTIQCRSKVKSGCATCRIRKVKCDEKKPLCLKCVNTGRTCDGYESPFRIYTKMPMKNTYTGDINPDASSLPIQPTFIKVTPHDIDLLNRYFSTKTLFDVELSCGEEAKQVLLASLIDPPVRYAVLSLRALREDLETSGDGLASYAQQTPAYHYGLQQYNMALRGLATNLSAMGSNGLKSALLCCQIFISIEQVQKNYAAMAQHIIRGLKIMQDYRARPEIDASKKLVLAYHERLPFLDVFVIKLFAAPCKFADLPATADISESTASVCLIPFYQQPVELCDLRTIVPDMRRELTKISALTLEFLDKVSQVESVAVAFELISEKAVLLDSLDSWLVDLEVLQTENGPLGPELISVSFLRLFYLILKIVLLGALGCSPDRHAELRDENDRLQSLANNLGERVKDYKTCSGTSSSRGDQFTVRYHSGEVA